LCAIIGKDEPEHVTFQGRHAHQQVYFLRTMPLPINLDDMLAGRTVEWERLEFKEGWNPQAILHTLCAFANDFHNLDGGYIFIGIAESDGMPMLPPTGLKISELDDLQKSVLNLGHKIYPPYHPIIEPEIVNGRHVLVLRSPGGQNRPYKAPISLSDKVPECAYYIRRGSSSVRANSEELVELFSLAAKVPFDDRVAHNASLADINKALIQDHLQQIGSELSKKSPATDLVTLCRKMELVGGPNENLLPRNVALMFFNASPDRFFPQAQIDVVQFPEGPGGTTHIEKTFKGPLSRQLINALEYISVNVIREYVIKRANRPQADRVYNYPYAAIEEILVNAVYHRSYEIREPIEVRVLPDKMTIVSYPGPDRSISLDDLTNGTLIPRRYRNRRLGEFLKELRLTEGRGTGIPTVISALKKNGSPEPIFQTDEDRSYFGVILPAYVPANKSGGQSGGQSEGTPTFGLFLSVNAKFLEMLHFCRTPRSRHHIMAHLSLKDVKSFRERYLQVALKEGLLEMTDPDHPRSHEQKFRTTEAGIQYEDPGQRAQET
jgi:ATP-dependent DNA helicase RecG